MKSQEAKISKQREIQAKKALEELEQEKEGESAEKIKSQNDFNSSLQSAGNGGIASEKSEVAEQYQLKSKSSQQAVNRHLINSSVENAINVESNQSSNEAIAEISTKPTVTPSYMMHDQGVLSSSADYVHHLNPNKPSLPEIRTISDSEDVLQRLNEKLIDNGLKAESLNVKIEQAESDLLKLQAFEDELNQLIERKEQIVLQLENKKESVEQKRAIEEKVLQQYQENLGQIKDQREIAEIQMLLDNQSLQLKQREDELLKGQAYIDAHKDKIIDFDEISRQLNEEVLANRQNQSQISDLKHIRTQLTNQFNDIQQKKNQLESDISSLQRERKQNELQLINLQSELEKQIQSKMLLDSENTKLKEHLNAGNQDLIAKSQALENIEIELEKKNDEITAHIEETNQLKERIHSLEQGAQWDDDLYRSGDFSDDESPKHRVHGASLYDELREFEDNPSPMALGVSNHLVVDPVVATLKIDNKALQTKLDQTIERNIELQEKRSILEQQLHTLVTEYQAIKKDFEITSHQNNDLLLKQEELLSAPFNLKKQNDALERENTKLNVSVDQYQKEINELQLKLDNATRQSEQANTETKALRKQLDDYELDQHTLVANYEEEIKVLHQQHEAEVKDLGLLNQEQSEEIERLGHYIHEKIKNDKEQLEASQSAISQYENKIDELEQSKEALLLQQAKDHEDISYMQEHIKNQEQKLETFEKNEIEYEEKIKRLKQDIIERESFDEKVMEYINKQGEEIKRLEKQLADKENISPNQAYNMSQANNFSEHMDPSEQIEQRSKLSQNMLAHSRDTSLLSTDSTTVSIGEGVDGKLKKLGELKQASNRPSSPQRKLTVSTTSSRSSSTDSRRSYTLISERKQKVAIIPDFHTVKTDPSLYSNGKQTQRYTSDSRLY